MKAIKILLLVTVVVLTNLVTFAAKKEEKTVVFNVVMHCKNCKARVDKNIPYEKGVKKLKSDLETQTVAITFREDKNTIENLRKALVEKAKVEVKGIRTEVGKDKVCTSGCCSSK